MSELYKDCNENELLSVAGMKAFAGKGCGYWTSRVRLAKDAERALCKVTTSKRFHIYTTSQLIELFAKRGDVSVRIANGEAVAIKAGDQSTINIFLSGIERGGVFKAMINTMSGPNTTRLNDGYDISMDVNVCEFIKLSANSIKSKSNLGSLFDAWNVPLSNSQRRSLGFNLK